MKNILYAILLFNFISCDTGSFNPSKGDELTYSAESVVNITNENDVLVKGSINDQRYNIYLYLNDSSCDITNEFYSMSAEAFVSGERVQVPFNSTTLIYYRVGLGSSNIQFEECLPLAEVTHDNTRPVNVSIDSSVLSQNFKTNQSTIHINFIDPLDSDFENLRFYSDSGATNLLSEVNADLWSNNQGFISLELNSVNNIYVKGVDRAGNESLNAVGTITIEHDNTAPLAPTLNGATSAINQTIITSSNITIQGSLDTDVENVEFYSSSVLINPIQTYTKAQFESGINYSLNLEQANILYIVAVDDFGNKSSARVLSVYHTASPNYNYALANTSYTYFTDLALNNNYNVSFFLPNDSRETTYNIQVPASALGFTESDPNLTIETNDCSSTGLEKFGSCELVVGVNFSSVGNKSINIDVNIEGTTQTITLEFNVVDPVIESSENTDASSENSTSFSAPFIDFRGEFITTNVGYYNLNDLSSIGIDPLKRSSLLSNKTGTDISLYPCLNGFCWFKNSDNTSGVHSVTPGLAPTEVIGVKKDANYVVKVLESTQDKLVLLNEDGSLVSSFDISVKGNFITNTSDNIVFIGDDGSGRDLYVYNGSSFQIINIPNFTIDDDEIFQVNGSYIIHGTNSTTTDLMVFNGINEPTPMSLNETTPISAIDDFESDEQFLYLTLSQGATDIIVKITSDGTVENIVSEATATTASITKLTSIDDYNLLEYTTSELAGTYYFRYMVEGEADTEVSTGNGSYINFVAEKDFFLLQRSNEVVVWDFEENLIGTFEAGSYDNSILFEGNLVTSSGNTIKYYNSLTQSFVDYVTFSDNPGTEIKLFVYEDVICAAYVNTSGFTTIKKLILIRD